MPRWVSSRLAAVVLALAAGLCGGLAGAAVTRHAAASVIPQTVAAPAPTGPVTVAGRILLVSPTGCTMVTLYGATVQVLVTDTTVYYVHPNAVPETVSKVELRGAWVEVRGRLARSTDVVAASITMFPHFRGDRPGVRPPV